MTIVLESYKDAEGIRADIEQDKYCKSFRLDIYRKTEDGTALTVYRNDCYTKIESARRAMRRILTAPIVKTFDYRKKS